MKIFIVLCQLCIISCFFLLTGCVSITTWKATGVETFYIKNVEITKIPDGKIRVLQKGISVKNYIPYLSFFTVSSLEDKIYIYSYSREQKCLVYSFLLKINKSLQTATKINKNLLILEKNKFDILTNKKIELNPKDISRLKDQPFFVKNFSANGLQLFIPYRSEQDPNGDIRLNCYSPLEPPLIIPDEFHKSYQKKMEGLDINLWRTALMPIPIVIDIATFPLQMLMLIFL